MWKWVAEISYHLLGLKCPVISDHQQHKGHSSFTKEIKCNTWKRGESWKGILYVIDYLNYLNTLILRQYEISAIHFRFIFRMPTSRGCDWYMGLPQWLISKECACQCRRHGFDPWVRKIPWRRKWQPTPAFLPRKYHGQRSLVGNSPGVTNSWTRLSAHTWACTHTHTHTHTHYWYSFWPEL